MKVKNLSKGTEKIINMCLSIKKGENLLIVADSPNLNVGMSLARAGKKAGAEISLILFEPRAAHAEDPPKTVIAAMQSADAAVLATSFSLSSSNARREANKCGTRIISIPGCCEDLFTSEAIKADFHFLENIVQRVGHVISEAKEIHVTTKLGTEIYVKLCGRKSVNQTALALKPGSWAPAPNIETAIGPCIDGVNGIFVVDGCIIPGGVPKKPVKIFIHNGKITKIEGSDDANKFKKLLKSFNNTNMYQIVEVGIGLNPKAKIGKNFMAEDESQFGTLHLGIGEGHTFGLPISAPAHFDVVIRNPKIMVNGQLIFMNEELVCDL